MKILITNDDGHDSILLKFLIEHLAPHHDLVICVPTTQRSWQAKSMTRFKEVHVEERVVHGHKAFLVDGTTADCVNLAIYNLTSFNLDLVVSGVNLGLNLGNAFSISSGTIGGCLEGNIAGIPGIAISQVFEKEHMSKFLGEGAFSVEEEATLRIGVHSALDVIFNDLISKDKSWMENPLTWNVNIPPTAKTPIEIKRATTGSASYGSFFKKTSFGYVAQLRELSRAGEIGSDFSLIDEGYITKTLIAPQYKEV